MRFLFLLLVATSISASEASRKVLFLDLWKLDRWDNVELRQGNPEWIRECEYRDPSFPRSGVNFPSVWIDEKSGKWRLIHSTKWSPFTMMIAESDDGVTWEPLNIGSEEVAPNHLLTVPSGSGGAIYHDPQATDGNRFRIFGRQRGAPVIERALADPNHRRHRAAKEGDEKRYIDEGITLVSRDGIDWEVKTGGHWNWHADDWFPEPPVFAFWNEAKSHHVMVARPGWGDRRQCLRTSPDLKNWSDPELQFQPDPLDTDGPIGMYGMPVHPVGNGAGYIGLLWVFHNSSSEPVGSFNQFFGTMDAHLTYSYDGVRFFRGKREPFLERNPFPEIGCTQVRPCSIVETEESIHIYSESNRGAHGRERSEQQATEEPLGSLMLHRLRKDGWMYLASQGDWAHFQTKPFALFSPEIRINAVASFGEVRFQITDEKSEPIPGFSFDDCISLRGDDSLDFALAWKAGANWDRVLDTPIRLEVKFRQANIYSIDMEHHFLDAHDQWLLKDGKPLPEKPRFDF